MQPSQFKQEFSELLATSKSSDAEFRALNSDALHQMHQSYGVAPHKWNQIENSPKLDYLFRADLETQALEREKKKDKAKMEIEQIEKDIRQMRIREIRNDFKKTAKRREKLEKNSGLKTHRHTKQMEPSIYSQHFVQPPKQPIIVKDWRFFNTITKDQDSLWNKNDFLVSPVRHWCNDRPHLDEWAREQEEKRKEMEIEYEHQKRLHKRLIIENEREAFRETVFRNKMKTTQLNSLTSTNTSQDFGSTTLDKQRSLLQRQTENVGQGRVSFDYGVEHFLPNGLTLSEINQRTRQRPSSAPQTSFDSPQGMQDRSGNDRIETEEWAGLTNHGPMQKQARPTTSIHHARKTQSNPSPTINYLPPHQSFDDVEEAVEIEDDEDLEEHEAALQQSPTEPAVSTEVHSGQPDGLQTQEQPRPLRHRPSDGRRQLSPTSSDAVIPAESTEQTPFNPNKEAHATSTERVLSARPPKMEVRTYPLLFVPVSEDESDTQPPKRQTQTRKPRPVSAQVSQPPLSPQSVTPSRNRSSVVIADTHDHSLPVHPMRASHNDSTHNSGSHNPFASTVHRPRHFSQPVANFTTSQSPQRKPSFVPTQHLNWFSSNPPLRTRNSFLQTATGNKQRPASAQLSSHTSPQTRQRPQSHRIPSG